jgi:hypothetical protein
MLPYTRKLSSSDPPAGGVRPYTRKLSSSDPPAGGVRNWDRSLQPTESLCIRRKKRTKKIKNQFDVNCNNNITGVACVFHY